MGQLWLRSEVDNLEYKMKYSSRKKSLPTCIVIDTDALINYSLIIKKLVNSTKFIVVVPAIGMYILWRINRHYCSLLKLSIVNIIFCLLFYNFCFSNIGTRWAKKTEQRSQANYPLVRISVARGKLQLKISRNTWNITN